MIRPYRDADAVFLGPIHSAVFPADPLSITSFGNYMASMRDYGGKARVIQEDSPLGYALTVPVPGLPHITDLKGCIAPPFQRRGLGSRLLNHVMAELQTTAVRQVTHQVKAMDDPGACFLQKNGFYVEHEEWQMIRNDLRHLAQPEDREGTTIAILPRSDAVTRFQHLFKRCFSGLPWDQPYSQREIDAVLNNANDILFLSLGSKLIGFAWLHLQAGGLGVVEPLGVLPEYQQQGYGRLLLLCVLQELARRGASQAQIGAWRTNQPAIHLYQSLGFTGHQTITFLAYDLIP